MSLIVLTPKRTVLGRNHVIWAIMHEYQPHSSSWALEEEKRSGQEKSHKRVIFHLFGRSPHRSNLHQKLCSKWRPWRNRVCQVAKWNFQGLRFYRGSSFLFSYWLLNRPYNSAALLHCLWFILCSFFWWVKVKVKAFPYSISSVGPGADPGVQAVSPQVSHPPKGRLPLLSARPAVTSPAAEHRRPLSVPSYTAWWQGHLGMNNLPKVVTQRCLE